MPDPSFNHARSWAESQGIPTTATFMVVATRVVKKVRERRVADKHIGDDQLARECARAVVTDLGKRATVNVCAENDRLRAVRLPPLTMANFSVEDWCDYVLMNYMVRVAKHTVAHGPHPLPEDASDTQPRPKEQRS